MPIALLLQSPFVTLPTLLAAAKALTPWIDIARIESTVLARARGAFMVGWFGRSFPRDGGYALIAIQNRAELDTRLTAALTGPSTAGAASTTTPAAAIAGFVSGIWLSPAGLAVGLWRIFRHGEVGFGAVAMAVVGLAFWVGAVLFGPVVVTGIAVKGVIAVGAAAGPLALTFLREQLEAILRTAAAATRAMRAITALFPQLLGPRAALHNPLLKAFVEFGDRLGGFGAQLLGAVAFVIEYVTPRIVPSALILVAIRQSAAVALGAFGAAVETLRAQMNRLKSGDFALSQLLSTFARLARQAAAAAWAAISDGIDLARATMLLGFDTLSAHLEIYLGDAKRYLAALFTEHPVAIRMKALTVKAQSLKRPPSKPSPIPELNVSDAILATVPDVALPDLEGIWKQFTAPALPPVTADAINDAMTKEFARDLMAAPVGGWSDALRASMTLIGLADRPSVFAAERADQQRALGENHVRLGEMTDTMSTLMRDRLTPGLWHQYEPLLAEHIDAFLSFLYPLPVKRADQPLPVQPKIHRLRIVAPAASETELRTLRDKLTQRLLAEDYAVSPTRLGR